MLRGVQCRSTSTLVVVATDNDKSLADWKYITGEWTLRTLGRSFHYVGPTQKVKARFMKSLRSKTQFS
jgi:hypothetical protein